MTLAIEVVMVTTYDIFQMHRECEMPRTASGVSALFIKMTRLGASIPEVAAIAQMTVERVKEVIGARQEVTPDEHTRMLNAFTIYLWWNCYRKKQHWARQPKEVKFIYQVSIVYWDDLCTYLKQDIEEAYEACA